MLDRAALPRPALADRKFWYVGCHDAGEAEIYREDAHGEELRRQVSAGTSKIVIERQFQSSRRPAAWTVWPFSRSGGWLEKVAGAV